MVKNIISSAILFFTFFPMAWAGPGGIQLPFTLTVIEDQGEAVISVRRVGGFDGPISVNFNTQSGTAVAGRDFLPTQGILVWLDQDRNDKNIVVPIINDNDLEDGESFSIRFSNPTGGAILPQDTHITVIVSEDLPTFTLPTNLSLQPSQFVRLDAVPSALLDLLRVRWVVESGPESGAEISSPAFLSTNARFHISGDYTVAFYAGIISLPQKKMGSFSVRVSGLGFATSASRPSKNIFNPFRGEVAEFRGELPSGGNLQIKIYDRFGREIIQLFHAASGAGPYQIVWSGLDSAGAAVPPGSYQAVIKEGGNTRQLKVIVLR